MKDKLKKLFGFAKEEIHNDIEKAKIDVESLKESLKEKDIVSLMDKSSNELKDIFTTKTFTGASIAFKPLLFASFAVCAVATGTTILSSKKEIIQRQEDGATPEEIAIMKKNMKIGIANELQDMMANAPLKGLNSIPVLISSVLDTESLIEENGLKKFKIKDDIRKTVQKASDNITATAFKTMAKLTEKDFEDVQDIMQVVEKKELKEKSEVIKKDLTAFIADLKSKKQLNIGRGVAYDPDLTINI